MSEEVLRAELESQRRAYEGVIRLLADRLAAAGGGGGGKPAYDLTIGPISCTYPTHIPAYPGPAVGAAADCKAVRMIDAFVEAGSAIGYIGLIDHPDDPINLIRARQALHLIREHLRIGIFP